MTARETTDAVMDLIWSHIDWRARPELVEDRDEVEARIQLYGEAEAEHLRAVLMEAHAYLDAAQWWHGDHHRAVKDVLAILNGGPHDQ